MTKKMEHGMERQLVPDHAPSWKTCVGQQKVEWWGPLVERTSLVGNMYIIDLGAYAPKLTCIYIDIWLCNVFFFEKNKIEN